MLGEDKTESMLGRVVEGAVGHPGCQVPSHSQRELRRLQLGSPENPAQELEEEEEEDKEEGEEHGRNCLHAS